MKMLCFEPVAGASGDMILAALFDLGADPAAVAAALRSSGLDGFDIHFTRRQDTHHMCCGFCDVVLAPAPVPHEHGPAGHHHHEHRHLAAILDIIARAAVPARAKDRASRIFRRLAEAEAAVHGVSPEDVHFHEVGAVDAIVDVFGACIALEMLGIERVYCSEFKVGQGTVTCAHGTLPVPVPATVRLLEGQPLKRLPIDAELTTPTGAAILTTLSEGDWRGLSLRLGRSGSGHGSRDLKEIPNILRAFLAETDPLPMGIDVLETDLDDESPEVTATLPELLIQNGALDATLTPLLMKKGRPGVRLTVLAPPGAAPRLAEVIFRNSSTIGCRTYPAQRFVLPRRAVTIDTPWGTVTAKAIARPTGEEIVPEYESATTLARTAGVPLRDVMHAARRRPGTGPSAQAPAPPR